MKRNMLKLDDGAISDFFRICFSLTVRKSSWQRGGSWKIHRVSQHDRVRLNFNPFEIFRDVCTANAKRVEQLISAKPTGRAYPLLEDSREVSPNHRRIRGMARDKNINLVVTSPPYGDHKTTVAYGQFSRHLGHWLDLPAKKVQDVDRVGLGGKSYNTEDDLGSPTLNCTLDKIQKNDLRLTKNKKPCRVREVYAYFYDLDQCLGQISQCLTGDKSHACFVVANRTVRRVVIPTNIILSELGRKYGFAVESVIPRTIPNKRMPAKNAPENIRHEAGETMTAESVIIMRC